MRELADSEFLGQEDKIEVSILRQNVAVGNHRTTSQLQLKILISPVRLFTFEITTMHLAFYV